MARTGAATGARIEESSFPFAGYGRESDACETKSARDIRRSFSRGDGDPTGGNQQSESDHRPLQRILQDAAAPAPADAGERGGALGATRLSCPVAGEESDRGTHQSCRGVTRNFSRSRSAASWVAESGAQRD